jgi:hypothetical protein
MMMMMMMMISVSIVLVRTGRGFLIFLRHLVGLLWTSDQSRRQGLDLHRTKTNIHASSGIRTHDPSNQAAKTYALDRTATGTGNDDDDRYLSL